MRYTKSEVLGMFKRLIKALSKANPNLDSTKYNLDYVSHYGGYVIEQAMNDSAGIDHPMGCMRRSSKEMYLSMYMTAQALENLRNTFTGANT